MDEGRACPPPSSDDEGIWCMVEGSASDSIGSPYGRQYSQGSSGSAVGNPCVWSPYLPALCAEVSDLGRHSLRCKEECREVPEACSAE